MDKDKQIEKENNKDIKNLKTKKSKKVKIKKESVLSWPIKIFFLALSLSLLFSVLSEFLLTATGIVVSLIIIIVLIIISVIFDMIGVAVTACNPEPLRAMAAKKVKGSKEALFLLKNADKVGSLCNDVIGDVCGILSGSAGAAIVLKFALEGDALEIIIASLVSSIIAGLTILGKALGKKYAINNCTKIIHKVGKCLSIFTRKK